MTFDAFAVKHVALYDKDLALKVADAVLAFPDNSVVVSGPISQLREQLLAGTPLSWSPPAHAGPTGSLMCRHLAFSIGSEKDFESGVSLALLHLDGKQPTHVNRDVLSLAAWFFWHD